ncbi:MAG TPA: PEGA domain-containing protein [Polyangiaceae bacterium]|jgi:hypothetical protein|nr:PEGA domain-containing protein [Polyangiaceae bacterium]
MKRSLVSVLLFAWVLAAAPAGAQSAAGHSASTKHQAPLAQALSGPAREAYASAQVLVNNGDYTGAFAKFGQAYDLSKDPRLLFNMAVCARNMHDYARMQNLLVRYQREAGSSMAADDKADVESALATIRTLVGAVKLSVSEAGAAVRVDGQQVGTTPLADPIVLNLGKHTLTVSKGGFQPVEQALEVAGGSETPVALTLVAQRHVARLVVASDEAATVVVDGQAAAKGRFDEQLAPGPHEVHVTEPGKLPYKAQVDLRDGETRSLEVTLENESHGAPIWPWIVGGVVVAAGAAVGGYFLFQPQDQTVGVPDGRSGTVRLSAWRH